MIFRCLSRSLHHANHRRLHVMDELLFHGLTWLLLPSVVPHVGAAHFLSQLTGGRAVELAQPGMRITSPRRTSEADHETSIGTEYPDNIQNKTDSGRFKRQPTIRTDPTTTEATTSTMKTPAPPSDAVVETRPDLVHPAFTTYLFSVTLPCVIAWIFVTWLCLWICRPHSPLYREILKRLIEHSQMKQKSVLFAATVLAGERKPPEDPTAEPTTSTK